MATKDIEQNVFDTLKFAKLVKQTYGRNSLTRAAQDSIAQFPVIMSADIPLDDSVIISKALEAQYAALLVTVISARSDYDRSEFSTPVDYLKTFHNNSNFPVLFRTLDSMLPKDTNFADCALESATTMHQLEKLVDPDIVLESFTEDVYEESTLNHSYRPEYTTQKAMESVVQNLRALHRPAMEADHSDDVMNAFGVGNAARLTKDIIGAPTKNATRERVIRKAVPQFNADGTPKLDANGKQIKVDEVEEKSNVRVPSATGKQEVVRNDKLTALEPTLINLQLTSHHGENGNIITHNLVIGVKAKTSTVPQNLMISNLSDGVSNSNTIFRLIKWSEGELHFVRDLIFGIDHAKKGASGTRDMRNWLAALKNRKLSDAISKFVSGRGNPPMTTIVTTSYEVAKVAEMTGMDLNDPYTAVRLLSKYYVLGLIIYDTDTGKVKSIFDGDTNFSVTTISAMKTKQQKDMDLMQYSQFIRAAGRM